MQIRKLLNNIFFDMKRLVTLDMFTSKEHGVADLLLPARFIDEHIILNVDGSLTICVHLRPGDLDAETTDTLNYVGEIVHKAFLPFETGWCMHLDNIRNQSAGYIPEDKCHFTDATTFSIDFERRMEYNRADKHHENEYVLTLTYLPPGDFSSNAAAFFMNSEGKKKPKFDYTIYLEKFKDTVYNALDILSSSQFKISPMTDDEILSYMFYCVNGVHAHIKNPKRHWSHLRDLIANQDIVTGWNPMVGDKHIRVISMGEQFPLESYPTLLNALDSLGFEYRWSTRYIFLSAADAKKHLSSIAAYHYQGRESASQVVSKKYGGGDDSKINRSAVRYADDIEEAITSIEMSNVRYGKYTSCVVMYDENLELLEEKVKIIKGVIDNYNLMGKIEKAHCFEAYLGSIPGMVRPNVRKWVMSSYNLADLLPTSAVWSGYKSNPCKYYADKGNDPVLFFASTAGTPFRGCLHVGDEGNALIIGSNVSMAMNFLAAQQCRYKDAKIFIFDNNHASLPLTNSIPGSSYYDIGYGEDSIAFQPLAHLDTQEDFSFAVDWLLTLCEIKGGFKAQSAHITIISEVLELVRKEASLAQRTITYVYYHILSRDNELAEQIHPYVANTGKSMQSNIFEARKDELNLSKFTTFELSMLVRQGDVTLVPTILYLFHMIERGLDGSPVSIYIHDGWAIFKHPIFKDYLDEWLRKVTDLNVQIIIGVHQPSDIIRSEIAENLMHSCKTKIYTANLNAKGNQYASYSQLGLNDTQIELISTAMVNRDYYFTNPLGSRLIQFQMGELAKVFLTPPSLDQIDAIHELKKQHGDLFGYEWIKHNQLIEEIAEFWLDTHNDLQNNKQLTT